MNKLLIKAAPLLLLFVTTAFSADNTSKTFTINKNQFKSLLVNPKTTSLHWKNAQNKAYSNFGTLKAELESQGKKVTALMNAGIYSKSDEPAGLHIENGNTLKSLNTKNGYGNFHLQPNGVFYITKKNQAHIKTTKAFKKRFGKSNKDLRIATQSGPMLLINGRINKRFIPTSKSKYTRNGVCTTQSGKLFFIATNDVNNTRTNLYEFAKAAKKIGCYQALYLDGSISKLYESNKGSTFHFRHYVAILAVTK